jgi:hypothetical protein
MRIRPLPLLLLFLIACPVLADDVYLVNGGKFEGVIAETIGSQVRIQMQGGILSLPKGQVLRVDQGDTVLTEYLHRKEALKKGPSTRGADWLELARWARLKGLEQSAREAALAAAALDPGLEGLGALLRGYGFVLDEQLGRWVTFAESMRRRGFVPWGGQWITGEEYAAKVRAREEEEARYRAARDERVRAAREDRLAALAELSMARELSRSAAPPAYPYPILPFYGTPVVVIPGIFFPPGTMKPPHKAADTNFTHVPGSLIGGNLFPQGN